MNWNNIRYIFQIPLSWFKKVHDLIFKSYGTDFIKLKEGEYGGLEIGIDNEQFDNRVSAIASSVTPSLSGVVTSVDGHSPDNNGAVSFGLTASKYVKTDSNGHLTTTNDNVISLVSSYNPQSVSLSVITSVTWSGTQLVKASKTLQFQNGVLVGVADNANTYINTVTYN